MSDKELFKAIKEYEEKHGLKDIRKANKILREIQDICRYYPICAKDDKQCPFYRNNSAYDDFCALRQGVPENWEIN